MKYEVSTNKISGNLFEINVVVYGATKKTVLLEGTTKVNIPLSKVPEGKTQEDVAKEYAENVFLADLRSNNEEIEGLTLPIDGVV